RPPPRCVRWSRSGADGAPSRCSATWPSSASSRPPDMRRWAGWRAGSGGAGRAAGRGVARLIAVAGNAAPILDGARRVESWPGQAILATDQAAAIEALEDLRPGDVVLVKGSRYRTWEVADALRPGASSAAEEVRPSGPSSSRPRSPPTSLL